MTRRKAATPAAEENAHLLRRRLARLLREAFVAAWVSGNSTHDAEEWAESRFISQAGFAQIAEELVKRGVRPPLED